MNSENTDKLYNDFPELYRGHTKSVRESAMPWGFECGNGWFQLIYNLSKEITDFCKKKGIEIPEVMQVKQKFGSLRYYYEGSVTEIDLMIEKAENDSLTTCEFCGQPGVLRRGGWLEVLCEKCVKER